MYLFFFFSFFFLFPFFSLSPNFLFLLHLIIPLHHSIIQELTDSFLRPFGGTALNSLELLNDSLSDHEPILFSVSHYFDDLSLKKQLTASKNSFSLLSLNVQSVHAKIEEVKIFLKDLSENGYYFDVLCFQETWMAPNQDDSQIQIDGYTCLLKGKSVSEHGGLAFYIKSDYKFRILDTWQSSKFENFFIEIELKNYEKPLIVGNIYRPPRNLTNEISAFSEELSSIMHDLNRSNSECILTGDFNIDLLKVSMKPLFLEFLHNTLSEGFIPKITHPTRFSNTGATLIDNFFCKISSDYSTTTAGILTCNISDHQPYFITLDYLQKLGSRPKTIDIEKRNPNFFNNLKTELQNMNLLSKINQEANSNPNENVEILQNCIKSAIDSNVTKKTVKFHKHKHGRSEWITPGIVRSIKFRDRLYLKWKRSQLGTIEHETYKTNLKTFNKILKKTIKNAKILYYERTFFNCQKDVKNTWKHINSILNRNRNPPSSLPDKLNYNGGELKKKQDIINSFNDHFSKVGKKVADSLNASPNLSFEKYLSRNITHSFDFQPVTEETVKNCINELAPKNSAAEDGISSKILKCIVDEISHPLATIINQCFITGTFPDCLKTARVKPLFKKGSHSDPGNYRPISILPSLSKVFEKVLLKQLTAYFTQNSILFPSQYGFRKGHSTDHAVLEFVDHIYSRMDSGDTPLSIFVDLTKAFDCLDHEILFKKLEFYGVRGSSLALLRSYLTNRKQFTECENLRSNLNSITTGVPQGSNLGPFLFLVYINDLEKCSDAFKIITYADDSTLISSLNSEKDEKFINTELLKVQEWLLSNKLSLNVSKTKFMIFRPRQKQIEIPSIKIDDQILECVDQFTYLGITLDKHLSWKLHVQKVGQKISKVNCVLAKLKKTLPAYILKVIYNSLVACHLNYGILLWGKVTQHLTKLQKRSIRIITNSKYNAHTEPLFKALGILKLEDNRSLQELIFFYKSVKGLLPAYFSTNYLKFLNSNGENANRLRNKLLYPRFRHEYFRQNLRYAIVKTVNNSPAIFLDKVETHSLKGFAHYIKNNIVSNYSENCIIPDCYVCRNSNQ